MDKKVEMIKYTNEYVSVTDVMHFIDESIKDAKQDTSEEKKNTFEEKKDTSEEKKDDLSKNRPNEEL